MDLLRGAAVLLVISYHLRLLEQKWAGSSPELVVGFSDALSPFRMPVLLFASGLLLVHSLEKPARASLRGKLRSLLWPWLLWSALMLPLVGWESAERPLWWLNGTFTWFLVALFLFHLVGLLARRLHPGGLALAFAVAWAALPLAGLELHMVGLRPDKLLYYAVFFFAGAALRRTLEQHTLPWPVLGLGLLVAAGWAVHAHDAGGTPTPPVLAHLVVLIALVSVVGILRRMPRLRALRPLERLGRHSIVPYLVHVPVMELLCRYADLPPTVVSHLILYALTLGVCVLALLLRPVTGILYTFPARRRGRHPAAHPSPRSVPGLSALVGAPARASVAGTARR